MRVNYSDEPICFQRKSIFLAGPTPRKADISSWRPSALKILEELSFEGVVYVPEYKVCVPNYDYLAQVEWEYTCLEQAGVIVFWVPRKLPDMPAFTTNVEFGRYVGSGRMLYGRPEWAEKKGYLDWLYNKVTGMKPYTEMEELMKSAILGDECCG